MKTKEWENVICFTHIKIQQLPLNSVIPLSSTELPVSSPGKENHYILMLGDFLCTAAHVSW